jgi:RNA polymerase-interacting CarD/CdnL/TRCF family regulator
MNSTPKFRTGQTVEHARHGVGRITEVYAVATEPDQETEYVVKLRGQRWPVTLAESNLTLVR